MQKIDITKCIPKLSRNTKHPHILQLLQDWNASIEDMLNSEYVLDSSRSKQLAESFADGIYARIHRFREDFLVLEIRESGAMYAESYKLKQDFSDLEELFKNKI